MAYKFINVGTFNINQNFWELNPQLIYIKPFALLYERDDSKNHSVSSKEMWCIWLHEDPSYENKVYRQKGEHKVDSTEPVPV